MTSKTTNTIRIISTLLAILMLLQVVPSQLVASAAEGMKASQEFSVAPAPTESEKASPGILPETEQNADAYTKTFTKSDGTMVDIVSTEPVNYYGDGEWKSIDNTLVSKTVGEKQVLQNKENIVILINI